MKVLDYVVTVLFLIALVVIAFFWGCSIDPILTAVAGVILIAATVATVMQNNKIKKLI